MMTLITSMHYYVIHDENTCIIFIFRNSGEILINNATLHFLAAHIKKTRNFHAFLVSPQKNGSFIQGFRICNVIEHKAATIDIIKWIPVATIFYFDENLNCTCLVSYDYQRHNNTHQKPTKELESYLQDLIVSSHVISSKFSNHRSIKNPCN